MHLLSQWPLEARRRITGIFTDIDDTLTHDGHIAPEALQALGDLKAAGLTVIPITGRPIGWCEPFMAGTNGPTWPVDAMVAENGAVAFVPASANTFTSQIEPPAPVEICVRRYQNDINKVLKCAPPTDCAWTPLPPKSAPKCRAWSSAGTAQAAKPTSRSTTPNLPITHPKPCNACWPFCKATACKPR